MVGVKRRIKLFSSLLYFLGAQIPWKKGLNWALLYDNHRHLDHDHMLPTWTYGWCTPSCWSSRPHHCRGWQEPPDVLQLVTDSSLAAVSLNFPIAKKSFHEMVILTSTRCIRRLWLDSGCWIGITNINHLLIPINDGLLLLCWSSNHLKGEELVDVDGLGVASSRLKPETRSVGQSRLQARNIKGHRFCFNGVIVDYFNSRQSS